MSDEPLENDVLLSCTIVLRQYDVLKRIFSYLPMRDVKIFARVNKLWSEVSSREKRCERNRMKPVFFSYIFPPRPTNYYASLGIGKSTDEDLLFQELRTFISEMRIDPAAAIIFSTGDAEDLHNQGDGSFPGFHLNTDLIDMILPTKCVSISTTVTGVVCTHTNGEVLEVENIISPPEIVNAVSIGFIPRVQGTKVIPFEVVEIPFDVNEELEGLHESNPSLTKKELNYMYTRRLCGFRLNPQDKVNCLLLLTNAHLYPSTLKLINSLAEASNHELAVGGGVGSLTRCSLSAQSFEDVVSEHNGDDSSYQKTTGFVLAGDNIKAASVVIRQKSQDSIETAMRKLKDCNFNESRSIAFAFICCARGRYYYHQVNVETSIFRRVFPTVPIVGGFCGGEIGLNFIPTTLEDPEAMPETKKKARRDRVLKDRDVRYSFTTVLVMISYD